MTTAVIQTVDEGKIVMSLMKEETHPDLSEYVIRLLKKRNILTVIDFLLEDSRKLATITNLGKSKTRWLQ